MCLLGPYLAVRMPHKMVDPNTDSGDRTQVKHELLLIVPRERVRRERDRSKSVSCCLEQDANPSHRSSSTVLTQGATGKLVAARVGKMMAGCEGDHRPSGSQSDWKMAGWFPVSRGKGT